MACDVSPSGLRLSSAVETKILYFAECGLWLSLDERAVRYLALGMRLETTAARFPRDLVTFAAT